MPQEILKKILNQNIIKNRDKSNNFILKEDDKSALLKTVKILEAPSDAIMLRLDGTINNKLFKGEKGINKRCDYVIFTKAAKVFIEMKSTNDLGKHEEYIQKYKGTACILAYLDAVISIFEQTDKIFANLKSYYVLFFMNSINKTNTTPKVNIHSTPEKFLEMSVPDDAKIFFKKLIS